MEGDVGGCGLACLFCTLLVLGAQGFGWGLVNFVRFWLFGFWFGVWGCLVGACQISRAARLQGVVSCLTFLFYARKVSVWLEVYRALIFGFYNNLESTNRHCERSEAI